MKDWKKYLLGYCLIAVLVLPVQAQILQIGSGTSLENYAASELQRYYYQLSGKLLNIERTASANLTYEIEAVNGNLLLGKVFQGERIT